MKSHVLIYDSYVSFEIMLATYFMKTKGDIVTIGVTKDPVISYEDFKVTPSVALDEVSAEDIQLLIIPGGDNTQLKTNKQLLALINALNNDHKVIATICSATELLELAGVSSKNHVSHPSGLEIHKNIISAKPNKYVDFAIEIGKVMNIYTDDEDFNETIDFFKLFKDS
ncbi:DJ-1/PfpI family protein [Paenibacillus sp. CMAA1739]|uniref:DJ-1/PfpI family protein n=1 Tax=Paenibacillus ottowii TaxID=2315729 RepID=UPI00272F3D8A|nr:MULTISPECIES: DJ-1/PfpI family protein [Paenibacillus]MDP1509876.1 DJ-1/PfpI family protein [Paenibacillus ottowii]MEC4567260.1 DJ-1/PfpI family protein [Paenibacillus sp. CMAA1739]